MASGTYHVYILASRTRRIYIGITRDLVRRLSQHRYGPQHGFTRRYGIGRLVHVESTTDVRAAIAREKQLKRWPRWRKERLIDATNPAWVDLADAWTEVKSTAPHAPTSERREAHRDRDGDSDTRAGSAGAPAG